jgi:hypothetical protein
MKILLAALMCLVLCTSECFALKGGPVYPGSTDIVGTYAGVLQGLFDPTNPASSNSIGVFSLGIPQSGLSTGTFIMFARGRAFTGTINATGDPNRGTVRGLLAASYNFNLQRTQIDASGNPVVVSIPITATANGPIQATIVAPKSGTVLGTATRLTGAATLSITGGFVSGSTGEPIVTSVLSLGVSGFKQSATATSP